MHACGSVEFKYGNDQNERLKIMDTHCDHWTTTRDAEKPCSMKFTTFLNLAMRARGKYGSHPLPGHPAIGYSMTC